ncbi:MAG: FAD/NAD(P)-binding protein [Wenzhouxiangellaceae bacterium]|nr:FAD/NAD(P)-binding protein [Wenzhouxiangellaceae bacterium]
MHAADAMRFDVAIIGCGASGALLATQLFRQAERAISICCIDPGARLGAGLAYGRCGQEHRLNVPAARISAIAGEDNDFVEWLERRGLLEGDPAHFYAPRARFADYLTDCIGRALRNAPHPHVVDHYPVRAVEAQPVAAGWRIRLASGETVEAGQAVLALGNLAAPTPPAGLETLADDTRYLHDPWRVVDQRIKRDRAVAVIGSGLTGVDVVQTLINGGHRGAIEVVSRSGQWPSTHVLQRNPQRCDWPQGSLHRLLAEVRSRIKDVEAAGGNWRDVVDGLRPDTQRLWQALSEREQRRFRRRLAGPWGRARHRMPPEIGRMIRNWQREGRVRVHVAPALVAEAGHGDIALHLNGRDAAPLKVRRVINATGPLTDPRRSDDPLLRQLLAEGRIRPGTLGVGLDADAEGRLLDADGRIRDDFSTLGPPRQGNLLESIAIPEIKVQALRLAERLLARMDVQNSAQRS